MIKREILLACEPKGHTMTIWFMVIPKLWRDNDMSHSNFKTKSAVFLESFSQQRREWNRSIVSRPCAESFSAPICVTRKRFEPAAAGGKGSGGAWRIFRSAAQSTEWAENLFNTSPDGCRGADNTAATGAVSLLTLGWGWCDPGRPTTGLMTLWGLTR